MTLNEIMERGFCIDNYGRVTDSDGNVFCEENGEQARISGEDLAKVKRETVMRYEAENEPYKYRDIRERLLNGYVGYKDISDEEINEIFTELDCLINEDDIEWATY
jgi:hypothetical protein